MASSLMARVRYLERDLAIKPGTCPECRTDFVLRRVDPGATPEQIDAARRCYACGRMLEAVKLIALTQEEWDCL